MNKELTAQEHRYMELRHMLEGAYKLMSNLEVENADNIVNFRGPAFVCPPHQFSIDFLGICVGINRFMKIVYKKQDVFRQFQLATLMAMYGGGIPVNGKGNFLEKIYKAFDQNQIALIFPEGDQNLGNKAVARGKNIITMAKNYQRRNRLLGIEKPEAAIIPVGMEYIESPVRIPWKMKIPTPFATRLIVRVGEPIFPSDHPDLKMDNYMKIIANLSNRPYAPDLEK